MPELFFYGGSNEIGGNKILLVDGATRLFFDFGISFKARGKYFEEFLKPRAGYGLNDFFQTGMLPPLQGIYRPDLEPDAVFWSRWQSEPLSRTLDHVDGRAAEPRSRGPHRFGLFPTPRYSALHHGPYGAHLEGDPG